MSKYKVLITQDYDKQIRLDFENKEEALVFMGEALEHCSDVMCSIMKIKEGK